MQSPRKLSPWPAYATLTVFAFDVLTAVLKNFGGVVMPDGGPLATVVRLAVWLWLLYELFGIRRILRDHLSYRDSLAGEVRFHRDPPSVLGTVLFREFYLQYLINRDILDDPAA